MNENGLVQFKQIVSYAGHSIAASTSVNLTFKVKYGELVNTIQLIQLLNNDVDIKAKVNGKPTRLGSFRIKSINVDGDGQSVIKFNSTSDFVEMDNLNMLPNQKDDVSDFVVMYRGTIEDEDEDESGDGDDE